MKALFLDAGGVFFLPESEAIAPELRAVGIDADDEGLARAHYLGMRGVDLAGGAWSGYVDGYAEAVAPEDPAKAADAIRRAFKRVEWSRVIASSVTGLWEIADTGVKLAVVSNSDGAVEGYFRDRGIAQVGPGSGVEMVTIVDSHVVGVAKPDPRIFEIALARVNVGPDEVVHVGDSVYADVEGAEAAGVRGVHFDPYALCDDDRHPHIGALTEVLDHV